MTTNESLVIENPYGRLFVHGLGNGAAMLLIEKQGTNMMLPLDADQVANLGRFMFFAQANDEARERAGKPLEASEPLDLTPAEEVSALAAPPRREPITPVRRPVGQPKGKKRGLPQRMTWTDEMRETLARLFVEEEAVDFFDTETKRYGRVAYAARKMGLPSSRVSAQVQVLRERGMIPRGVPNNVTPPKAPARPAEPTEPANGQMVMVS